MEQQTREQLIVQTLEEYSTNAVPDDLSAWPAIKRKLQLAQSRNQASNPLIAALSGDHVLRSESHSTAHIRPSQRRSGLSFAAALVAALGLVAIIATFLMSQNMQRQAGLGDGSTNFVPEGKVRRVMMHVTWSDSSAQANSAQSRVPPPRTDEIWYGNGPSHLLMYVTRATAGSSVTETTFVDDNAIYEYPVGTLPGAGGGIYVVGDVITKFPYTPRYLEFYGPDPQMIGKSLQSVDTRLVGNTTYLGREVAEIESASIVSKSGTPVPFTFENGTLLPTPAPKAPGEQQTLTHVRKWIDVDTHQVLKWVVTVTQITGPNSGDTEVQTISVVSDELLDAADFPLPAFEFRPPQGARIVERPWPPTSPTQEPAVEITPTATTVGTR